MGLIDLLHKVNKYLFAFLFCSVWAAIVPPARAQWICNVTEGANFDQGTEYYWYTALSCKGNVCVAAAIASSGGVGGVAHLAFLRSDDGGQSWVRQDPGLPTAGWDQIPIFTNIDLIDSLNIVAVGDSNILIKTSNGGATWQEDTVPTHHIIEDISFSSPTDGILVAADTTTGTFITSDGGEHWNAAPFTRPFGWRCHDYGSGKYRIFQYWYGKVYTTPDGWNTVDSTGPIVPDAGNATQFGFAHCSFGRGDTMIAYGRFSSSNHPCIARTTDGGEDWSVVFDDSIGVYGTVSFLSDLNGDTILAGTSYGNNNLLWSTNRGANWSMDTLICEDSDFVGITNYGIGLNSFGNLVASYAFGEVTSSLIIGKQVTSGVNTNWIDRLDLKLYPNPASTSLTLTGDAPGRTMHLLDLLGRDVLTSTVPADGKLTLDVSTLPPGLYFVYDGASLRRLVKE